ncbi:MAG: hypothetical protein M1837_004539 [Sclerophora amabilis]|nr:MAG: hypothetical protein M1837_004539 [Sclerophora amabilis]
MAFPNHIENIVVVGASGNLGSIIFKSLIEANRFNLTVVTRPTSTATYPPSVKVLKGDYNDPSFLKSAFARNDALILTLAFTSTGEDQVKLVDAAAAAGIKWILPTEYGGDNSVEAMRESAPFISNKTATREKIEELGANWIGVVTNIWLSFSLNGGMFDIDVPNHAATLYDKGTTKFNTTNLPLVGKAVAALMSLPLSSESGASLSDYKNEFVYIRSHLVSQRDILISVQRITGTTDNDWKIEYRDAGKYIQDGNERAMNGDYTGFIAAYFGLYFKEGMGGNFEGKGVANSVLGLPENEDLDEAVKQALEDAKKIQP